MGAVNIFLGGTGKAVAEDIQDSRDFYGLSISSPVVFDLDPTVRPGIELDGFVTPDVETIEGVTSLAVRWSAMDPGPSVGPSEGAARPGPELSPEHALLAKIGSGIAANPAPAAGLFALRAHGLAMFSMLFDEGQSEAGSGPGHRLRALIESRVADQTTNGEPPRLNLVTSTAGGTGAGTVIPLALWLKRRYPSSPISLIAVTASAFGNVLKGNPALEELAAKGRSGTYAILRELSFLQEADPQTEFSVRHLPVTARGLEYRPGERLFDRVYWFGGRQTLPPRDAFEEAAALLRVLSYDDTADELRGATGAHPLQTVGSVTAIEYPKLRLQRKLVSSVLEGAYEGLRIPRATYAGAESIDQAVSVWGYVGGGTERVLGAWFFGQRNSSLALGTNPTSVDERAADDLTTRLHQASQVSGYDAVSRGTLIRGDGYDSEMNGWRAYVGQVLDGLNQVARTNQESLQREIEAVREREQDAFAAWLSATVFGDWLSGSAGSGGPLSTSDVLQRLDRLEQDTRTLEKRLEREDLFPVDTTAELDAEVLRLTDKFDTPDQIEPEPTVRDKAIAVSLSVIAGLVGWWIATLIPAFTIGPVGSDLVAWFAITATILVTYRGLLWLLLRGKRRDAQLPARRRSAEDSLFRSFSIRDRGRALRWMHEELRVGARKSSFFSELRDQIRSVHASVERLDELYEGLADRAAAEAELVVNAPAHVKDEVGICVLADVNVGSRIAPEFRQRLRVEATMGPSHRVQQLNLKLSHFDDADVGHFTPVSVEVGDVLKAVVATDQAGLPAAKQVASQWESAVWSLVNWQLGEALPEDFGAALLYCSDGDPGKATASLASKLKMLELPRTPSVAMKGNSAAPVLRRMYVGNPAIQAEFNRALQHESLSAAQRRALDYYSQNFWIVPSLGEQIAFVDLWADPNGLSWAPRAISNAVEARPAMETYYGAEAGVPAAATANRTSFTVLPELLAATKLELGGNVAPLLPAVTSRLLGSDLDTRGPTYAELFYLLRSRGHLKSGAEGTGPSARTAIRVSIDGVKDLRLASHPVGELNDETFGSGRSVVIAFDAFSDFLRFDGTPLIDGATGGPQPHPSARVFNSDWAGDPRGVAALQRSVVSEWYHGDVDTDCAAMIDVLEADLRKMEDGDTEVRRSWEQAMRRLLAGSERRGVRKTALEHPEA